MHPLASVALALVLIAARPAQAQAEAQAPAPPGFLDAAAVVEGLVVDMRYFGDDNFVGARIDGYERARCLLSAPAASALAAIARDLAARALGLKVFDCYRPQRAVAHFVRWAQRIDDIKNKPEFYPDVPKRDLFKQGYISERSAHSRGSTVDLTLVQTVLKDLITLDDDNVIAPVLTGGSHDEPMIAAEDRVAGSIIVSNYYG